MSQNSLVVPDSDGATFLSNINNALQALASTSKGPNRPSTVYTGQMWIDDNTPSASIWSLYVYDGTDDILLGYIDTGNGAFHAKGGIIQIVEALDGTYASTSHTVPFDNTPPQASETEEFTQAAINFTPKSATSILLIELIGWFANDTGGGNPCLALFKDSNASATAVGIGSTPASTGYNAPTRLTHKEASGSVTPRTYKFRFGASAGTTFINGGTGSPGALFGGTMLSGMRITEIEL